MALTKVTRNLLSTGIDDQSDATAITITSAENVGIGTASPNAYSNVTTLTINGTNQGRIDFEYGGTHGASLLALSGETQLKAVGSSQVMTFEVNNAERARFATNGYIGLGTNVPDNFNALGSADMVVIGDSTNSTLTCYGTQYGHVAFADSSTAGSTAQYAGLIQYFHDTDQMRFYTNSSSRVWIKNDGDVSIGTSSATGSFYNGASSTVGHGLNPTGYAAHVRGGTNTPLYVSHSSSGDGTYIHFYQNTTGRGSITQSGGNTLYNATSDYRLKENVVDIENATSRINSLRPVNFDWIESGENSEGFIAHEAQSIVPYAVEGTHNEVYTEENSLEEQADLLGTPKYQAIDYGKLTPLLVKALQEANAKIESLETRIETLENA